MNERLNERENMRNKKIEKDVGIVGFAYLKAGHYHYLDGAKRKTRLKTPKNFVTERNDLSTDGQTKRAHD